MRVSTLDQAEAAEEGKDYNPYKAAHFPPPRLYGSSRLSTRLTGSPLDGAYTRKPTKQLDESNESAGASHVKAPEEEALPDFPFPTTPNEALSLIRSIEKLHNNGRTHLRRSTIVGRKLFNFRDLSGSTYVNGS